MARAGQDEGVAMVSLGSRVSICTQVTGAFSLSGVVYSLNTCLSIESVRVWAFSSVLTLHSLRSLHFASSSALVLAKFTPLPSLWFQREYNRELITQDIGSSSEGSTSRSMVSTVLCSAPGWYPCSVDSSLAGRPWLSSQVNRACSRVSGRLSRGPPQC